MYDWRQHLRNVPRLYLPKLRETLDRYVQYVRPIAATEAERKACVKKCEEFAALNGPRLQDELNRRRDALGDSASYISPFWDDMYLQGRYPVTIHSNPCVSLRCDPLHTTQSERATALVHGFCKWWILLRAGHLPPDAIVSKKKNGTKSVPLCVESYSKLMGTVREAVEGRDILRSFPESRHVCFLRGSRIFALDVIDERGRLMAFRTLKKHIDDLLLKSDQTESDSSSPYPPAALLTSLPRSVWASVRSRLDDDILRRIDRSLFVVSLDRTAPDGEKGSSKWHTNAIRQWLCGDVGIRGRPVEPRWYDKLTIAVAPDGSAGINFEHSPYDAVPLLRLLGEVHADAVGRNFLPKKYAIATMASSQLRELDIRPPEYVRSRVLPSALAAIRKLSDQTKVHALTLKGYGAKRLKSWGMSPDGIAQVAFQLAYRAQHGKEAYPTMSVYESVATNRFRHGRTEAGRTVTKESVRFVQGAVAYVENGTRPTESERRRFKSLLEDACVAHSERIHDASAACGVDRHLFALYKIALEEAPKNPLPRIFADPLWSRLNTSVLSTSRVDATDFVYFISYGPVCAHGYGVPYMMGQTALHLGLTSFSSPPDVSGGFGGISSSSEHEDGGVSTGTDSRLYGQWIQKSFAFLGRICEEPVSSRL